MREEKRRQKSQQLPTALSEHESGNDEYDDSEFNDDSFMYEKKLNILHITHIIFWKAINEKCVKLQDITLVGQDAVRFILDAQKKFILLATSYLTQNRVQRTMPTSSSFFTNLITFIDRVIITDKNWFINEILSVLHRDQNLQFANFVHAWFSKMDFIASRESIRINLIAIYALLPHFTQDMVAVHFREIGRLTFQQLDNYMYLKLTNNSCRFHSPSQMNSDKCTFPYGGTSALQQKNVRLVIQYAEKMSQRMDQLKKEDPILEYDLIDCFNESIDLLKRNLGWTSAEPLMDLLNSRPAPGNILNQGINPDLQQDSLLKNQFKLLVSGQCTKQQQVQKENSEQ